MTKKKIAHILDFLFFFIIGAFGACVMISALFVLIFRWQYKDRVYPGVRVDGINFEGYSKEGVVSALESKYLLDANWQFTFDKQTFNETSKSLGIKVASARMGERAFEVGRNSNYYYSFLQIISAYLGQINIPVDLDWDPGARKRFIEKITATTDVPPVEAQFKFEPNVGPDRKGRVAAFVQSKPGIKLDQDLLEADIRKSASEYLQFYDPQFLNIKLVTHTVSPDITSEEASDLKIVDKLGSGESYFYDSIPGRVYNIGLGTQKVSGSLIAPGETFSFDQAIGTVSAIFGFQKAYAIVQGKTVLDDGGGVCQVSTTLYRAVLNAGLPVVEREGHSYRVGFYEQGGFLPGMDATVYPPSPDFKFKNDTGNWLLVQGFFDKDNSKLTFEIYGKSDGRVANVSKPVIMSTSPPPDPIYEDDPNLPVGQQKQVDTAHSGANVYFTRTVVRGGETIINEKVTTNYIPWPARFLRGTKT